MQTKQHLATRAARIAKAGTLARAQRTNAKQQAYVAATATHNQQAYLLAVQQLAAQYGLPAPATLAVRAVSTKQSNPASSVQGACALVRTWCAANPTATVAAAKQHFSGTNYINPSTVATQHGITRKLAKQASITPTLQ